MPGLAGRRSVPGSMSRLTAALDRFPWLKTAREAALFAHRRGREVRLQQVAGSLTFTTVLSIVPLFAVALALFSVFPYFADFREAFQSLVQRTLPAQISSTVLRYLERVRAAGDAPDSGRPDLPRPDSAVDDHDRRSRAQRHLAGA